MTKSYYYVWLGIWSALVLLHAGFLVLACTQDSENMELLTIQTATFVIVIAGMGNHICKRSEVKENGEGQEEGQEEAC